MSSKTTILEKLEQGIVLGAQGYLFELERRGYVKAGAYVPEVVLDYPDAVTELHKEFLRAGAEVMVALTYYSHRDKMKTIGRNGETEELNRRAIRLAKEVAAEGDSLVAGNISNTGVYDHHKDDETSGLVKGMYEEQVRWAVEEGVDFIIAETLGDAGEARIALSAIKQAGLPAMVTFASVHETTRDGYTFEEACRMLADAGADIVGLNCSRGPNTMLPLIEKIRRDVSCAVAAQPVAYRTTVAQPTYQVLREPGEAPAFPLSLDPFIHTRFEMADFAVRARDAGVNYIGICCGAAPHHVRSMAEALGRTVPASRYSPDMSQHPMLGTRVAEKDIPFLRDWKPT